ncbi:MAG: tetratricopeptide repeat protein, partial [Planctomycetales bacterium]|nr:tetratricopeptide repeat protein [Planctomycetales bacterium]
MSGSGQAFLTDFGLAKSVATGSKLTRTGQALGTPAYMSPEQARGETSSLAPATDVWSLGCALHEMLAGGPPWAGETTAAIVAGILSREPAGLRALRPDVPVGVERVVRAALAKDPARRPADAAALRDDLDRTLRGEAPLARPPRGRHALWLPAAAAAIAAVALLPLLAPGEPGTGDARPAPDLRDERVRKARALRARDPAGAAALLAGADPAARALRLERADCLREAGEWSAAEAEYTGLLDEDPSDLAARYGRGAARWLGMTAGRVELPAPGEDLRVVAEGPPGPRRSMARAMAYWGGQSYEKGLRELEGAGGGWDVHATRGILALGAGAKAPEQVEQAVREFTAALEGGPPIAWVFAERSDARLRLGDLGPALEDVERALAMRPSEPNWLELRAMLRYRGGDAAGGLADLEKAAATGHRCPILHANLALVRIALGDPDGALADAEEAVRLVRDESTLTARGLARRAARQREGARADLEAVLALAPADPEAWNNAGIARKDAGDVAGAREAFDRALALRPAFPEVLASRADLRSLGEDWAGAEADYTAALGIRPGWWQIRNNRSLARQELGDLRGALADLDEALRSAPEDPELLTNRGGVRRTLGDLAGAAEDH